MVVNSETVRKFLRDLVQHTKTHNLNEAEAAARAAQKGTQSAIMASLAVGATTGWSTSLGGLDLVVFSGPDGGAKVVTANWTAVISPDYKRSLEALQTELGGGPASQGTPDICDAFGNQATFYRDVTMLMLHGIPA